MKVMNALKDGLKSILPNPSIVMDDTLGYGNRIRYLQKLLRNKQWVLLEEKLSEASKAELPLYISHLASTTQENANYLAQWLKQRPKEIYPLLVNAEYFKDWAWDARGTGMGSTVNETMAELFIERLHQAYMLLTDVIELDPNHVEAYHQMVTLGMAHPYIDKNEIITKMNEIDREHFSAQSSICYALTERWGGKKDEAIDYVFKLCNDRPRGDTLHGLIAFVHIEEWVGLDNMVKRGNYFLTKDVKYDIFTSYKHTFPNEVFRDDIDSLYALNAFAVCFYLARRIDKVKKILIYLKKRSTPSPWHYLQTSPLSYLDENYSYSAVHKEMGIYK
jgi:hypothetical protein